MNRPLSLAEVLSWRSVTRWLICAFALGLFVAPTVATADIRRSCSGTIEIIGSDVIAKVNGEGTCARKAKANQCRERARQAIVGCANALWAGRNKDKIPDACKVGRGAATVVLQWNQIMLIPRGNSLRDRVRWNKCCKERNSNGSAPISLSVSGDKGCFSLQAIGFGVIGFDCARDRMKLCPPKRASPD